MACIACKSIRTIAVVHLALLKGLLSGTVHEAMIIHAIVSLF